MDALESAVATLREGEFKINDDYTETHLTGTLTATGDKTVFTTVPYDEGWIVKVDGARVETGKTLNALLCFDVTEGEHTVELLYCPRVLVVGILCSAIFILLFLSAVAFRKQLAALPFVGVLFGVRHKDGDETQDDQKRE